MKTNSYILGFQGIRGYACLLIFLSHFNFVQNAKGVNITGWWGGLGVELFIILSGYLFMERHAEERNFEYKTYIIHKIKKFFPLHLITMLLAIPFVSNLLFGADLKIWITLVLNGLLLQAWIPDAAVYFSLNAVSWYLSMTMFFILISPLVIRFFRKLTFNMTVFIMFFLVAVEFFWCWYFRRFAVAHWLIYIFPIIRSIDYLLGGGVFALVQFQKLNQHCHMKLLNISIIFLVVILMLISMSQNSEWFSVFVWVIPSLLLIYINALGTKCKVIKYIFENRIAITIGNLSFEFFLFHQLIIRYFNFINSHVWGLSKITCLLAEIVIIFIVIIIWKNFIKKLQLLNIKRR